MQLGTHTPQLGLPPLEQPGAVRRWEEDAALEVPGSGSLVPGSEPETSNHKPGTALMPHDPAEVRAQIGALEAALRQHPEAVCGDAALPVRHTFADGCYIRELFVPKGTVYVGKLHQHSHPRFLLQGRVLVVTETGGRELCTAPSYLITPAGTKRAGLALEDSVIVTVHANPDNTRDLDLLEAQLIAPDYEALALPQAREEQV